MIGQMRQVWRSFRGRPFGNRMSREYPRAPINKITIRQLSDNKEIMGSENLKVRSCSLLRNSVFPEYVGSPHLKLHNIIWRHHLQNIYVVKKPWNSSVRDAMIEFIEYVNQNFPDINIIVSEDVADELISENIKISKGKGQVTIFTGGINDIVNKTDLIVTLGGDGTILRAVSAFSNSNVPPVLSFALGTLGFLLPFDFLKFKESFQSVYDLRSKALHRNRLECHVVRKKDLEERKQNDIGINELERIKRIKQYELDHYKQNHQSTMIHAMNDILLHRGSQPNLISLDIFIDNEFLTTTTADGILFSTPTGSTAYSLSAGGSITHPLVPCILLTPICPRSLSFRPLILPQTSHIMIKLSDANRNVAIKLNIDGIPQRDLKPGDQIHVVSENGTIYIPGKYEPPLTLLQRNEFDFFIEPGSSNGLLDNLDVMNGAQMAALQANQSGLEPPDSKITNLKQRGIWCVSRTENDWTKDINELLGFNSSFRGTKRN